MRNATNYKAPRYGASAHAAMGVSVKCIAVAFVMALTMVSSAIAQNVQAPSNVNLAAASSSAPGATPTAMQAQSGSIYRLGSGDQLHIIVYGETDLTGDFTVSPVGTIAFPLIGEVPATGLTPDQLSQAIADRLEQGYMRHPQVSAAIASYRPFFILGEVARPGTYPFSAALTVRGAVAVAGGFTYRANEHRVFIKHSGEQEEHPYRLDAATIVQPGDTIRIGERFF
jgi:polysaccharide biosynthesis/export protein